jgi:predicted ester cyclase
MDRLLHHTIFGNDRGAASVGGEKASARSVQGARHLDQKEPLAVTKDALSELYRGYIACLNRQDWPSLYQFVADDVTRNGQQLDLSGYRAMLERDFEQIPDLYFSIRLLISDPPYVASRLGFDCSPKGTFLGLNVNGRRVSFTENVFYEYRNQKIAQVWSVIDKAAIEAALL